MTANHEATPHRQGTLLQAIGAVMGSFLGIRRSSDRERDVQRLGPGQVVMVGIVAAALFVLALVLLVRWVVGSGVAG